MNNQNAERFLKDCDEELLKISKIIEVFGGDHDIVPFLTKYSIIRVCGAFEECIKTIIYEKVTQGQNIQIKTYIDKTLRNRSLNINLDVIIQSLTKFDENWNKTFNEKINNDEDEARIKDSIKSLYNSRNSVAHGKDTQTTFNNLKDYFENVKKVLDYIDNTVNTSLIQTEE